MSSITAWPAGKAARNASPVSEWLAVAGLTGLAAAVLLSFAAGFASAADLGGSLKDGPAAAPVFMQPAAGPCYFRADAGYSMANRPTVKWPVRSDTQILDAAGNQVGYTSTFITDDVSNGKLDNTWLGEFGYGCSFGGSRGFRLEMMGGAHGKRNYVGEPGNYTHTIIRPAGGTTTPYIDDPMHFSIKTYTLMVNAYKDFGNFAGFIPYVGVGIGLAYNQMSDVYFTGNPFLTNTIYGDNDLSLAWSAMAGVGYQLNNRAIIDVGYRYLDTGRISSAKHDNGQSPGFVNPRVNVDDYSAHEIKVGLRYHYGCDTCSSDPMAFQPMK